MVPAKIRILWERKFVAIVVGLTHDESAILLEIRLIRVHEKSTKSPVGVLEMICVILVVL